MRLNCLQAWCIFIVGYALVALAASWPLPLHLMTHLTGPPGGDTGVYVWNTWVFRHQLVDLGRQPYATDAIFWSGLPANLSLHNYTPVADLLAMAFQPLVGTIGAFNIIYLLNGVLAGAGMCLLASRYTSDRLSAWVAGAVFMCSPYLVARSLGHFSLAAAAPLPFFVWQLERTFETSSWRRAAGAGAIAAWAGMCDPYYLVYCLMLFLLLGARRYISVSGHPLRRQWRISGGDVWLLTAMVGVVGLALARVSSVTIGRFTISMHTLYTPAMLVTMACWIRIWRRWQPRFTRIARPSRQDVMAAVAMGLAAAVVLAPWLVAIVQRVVDGTMVSAPVLWRSSTPGVDLVGLLLPNPSHPLMPAAAKALVDAGPGGFIEQVASLPLVALALIGLAARGGSLSRRWIVIGGFFALVALGPFVHVAGANTYIPTPWAFLRYVPIIADARTPSRFAVVAVMAVSVLLAQALEAWRARPVRHRRWMTAAACGALMFELVPAPRPLFSAAVPPIYTIIRNDPRPVGVLELPFGLRDGLSSLGNFSASTQFYQTYHHKPVFGGYLSRISNARKQRYRRRPVLGAFMKLSEGGVLTRDDLARAVDNAPSFLERSKLGYVIIDDSRTPRALRELAIQLLDLQRIGASGTRELFVPRASAHVNAAR